MFRVVSLLSFLLTENPHSLSDKAKNVTATRNLNSEILYIPSEAERLHVAGGVLGFLTFSEYQLCDVRRPRLGHVASSSL